MSLYEIEIYRQTPGHPVDMKAVYAALEAGSVWIDKEERRTGSEGDTSPEYVYVDGDVSKAVQIINALGYHTDEDEEEDEDE